MTTEQALQQQTKTEQPKASIVTGAAWLLLTCFIALGYGASRSDLPIDSSVLFGECIGGTLIFWGIFHYTVARRRGGGFSAVSFVLILVALTVGTFASHATQKEQLSRMDAGLRKDLDAITSAVTQARPVERISTTPAAAGETGEMEKFIRVWINQMVALQSDYLRDLEAIGWSKALDPQRIARDPALVDSKVMVGKARGIVNAYRAKALAVLESGPAQVDQLQASDATKRGIKAGMEKSMVRSKPRMTEIWDLEAKTVEELAQIFELLSREKGKWVVRDRKIVFQAQNTLTRFNQHISAINTLSQRQQVLQKEGLDSARAKLENLGK